MFYLIWYGHKREALKYFIAKIVVTFGVTNKSFSLWTNKLKGTFHLYSAYRAPMHLMTNHQLFKINYSNIFCNSNVKYYKVCALQMGNLTVMWSKRSPVSVRLENDDFIRWGAARYFYDCNGRLPPDSLSVSEVFLKLVIIL